MKCLANPFGIFCSKIIANDRLRSLSKALKRHDRELLHDTSKYGHGAYCKITSIFEQR